MDTISRIILTIGSLLDKISHISENDFIALYFIFLPLTLLSECTVSVYQTGYHGMTSDKVRPAL